MKNYIVIIFLIIPLHIYSTEIIKRERVIENSFIIEYFEEKNNKLELIKITSYYRNNLQKEYIEPYYKGKLHGDYISWHENGKKLTKGKYELGLQEGTWRRWNYLGQKVSQENYDKGKLLSKVEFDYHKNGNLQQEASYNQNGKMHGIIKTWWENGSKRGKFNMENGKLDGMLESWLDNGIKDAEVYFVSDSLTKGTFYYADDGNKKLFGSFKDSKFEGLWTGYYKNSSIKWEGSFSGGTFNTKDKIDSYLDSSGVPLNGRVGNFIYYYKTGQKSKQLSYNKNSKLNGEYISWYENGQIRQSYNLINGYVKGLVESWYENGQKRSVSIYKNGKKNGKALSWYENGQKSWEETYINGNIEGLAESWYENGQKQNEVLYKNGKRNGKALSWYENGQPLFDGEFKEGLSHGIVKKWHENGQKSFEAKYDKGTKIYKNEWDENGNKVDNK